MERYRQEIIDSILSAQAGKVETIIVQSLMRLKQNRINEYLIQRYSNKMLGALLEIKENGMLAGTAENIKVAIELFNKILGAGANK